MEPYSEDEQLEKLKKWWIDYGAAVTVGIVIGTAMIGGYKYWNHVQKTSSEAASIIYDEFVAELPLRDIEALDNKVTELKSEYDNTPYAELAALHAAKLGYDKKDKHAVESNLKWVISNAKSDATRQIARLRLSAVLSEMDDIDQALIVLGDTAEPGFESYYFEKKGDLLLKKGEVTLARESYQKSLKHLDAGSSYKEILQMKIDNIDVS